MRKPFRWLLPLLFVGGACARRAALPAGAPTAPAMESLSGLRVLLLWSAPVDIDLYLTDPTSETVYFANNPSRSGARLLRDTRCSDVHRADSAFMEVAHVLTPRPGRYRVGVDFIDRVAPAQPVSYRIVVDLAGVRREVTGVSSPQVFQAIAFEFEVHQGERDGLVMLSRQSIGADAPSIGPQRRGLHIAAWCPQCNWNYAVAVSSPTRVLSAGEGEGEGPAWRAFMVRPHPDPLSRGKDARARGPESVARHHGVRVRILRARRSSGL